LGRGHVFYFTAADSNSDGRIVYEQRSPGAPDDIRRSVIVVSNPDGSAPCVVSPGTDPSWSPDGLLLLSLFKIWEPQKDELWIATAAADGAMTNTIRGITQNSRSEKAALALNSEQQTPARRTEPNRCASEMKSINIIPEVKGGGMPRPVALVFERHYTPK
jgi:hypothetical protein